MQKPFKLLFLRILCGSIFRCLCVSPELLKTFGRGFQVIEINFQLFYHISSFLRLHSLKNKNLNYRQMCITYDLISIF